MESSSGGNGLELLCKTLQVEHKLFYFDLKENSRGRYLKISEKTSASRSTVIVPVSGIVWFLDIFNYYCNSHEQEELFSKELQLDTKVFYFDIGENKRGRVLKVSEASVSRNCSTIIIPARIGRDEGWAAFRNILAEIKEASRKPLNLLNSSLGFQMMWVLGFYLASVIQPYLHLSCSWKVQLKFLHQMKLEAWGCPKCSELIRRCFSLILGATTEAIS